MELLNAPFFLSFPPLFFLMHCPLFKSERRWLWKFSADLLKPSNKKRRKEKIQAAKQNTFAKSTRVEWRKKREREGRKGDICSLITHLLKDIIKSLYHQKSRRTEQWLRAGRGIDYTHYVQERRVFKPCQTRPFWCNPIQRIKEGSARARTGRSFC